MPTKVVSIHNLGKELKAFGKKSVEEYRLATIRGVAASFQDLVNNSPVDTGQYASSWDMTVSEQKVLLGNFAPHAAIIEFGARPFTPPMGPLLAWAKRVLVDPSQPPNYSDHVWALAKYTQNKIAEFGMEPKHVLENEIPNILQNIIKELKTL